MNNILNKLKRLDQTKVELNAYHDLDTRQNSSLLSVIIEKLLSIGGETIVFKNREELEDYVKVLNANDSIVNAVQSLPNYNVREYAAFTPGELSFVKRFITRGSVGVAESGAIWVSEENIKVRVLPFICEHLYLVLSESELVFGLEEAYRKIGDMNDGYGVFIAGPSKTADIEQSLVIGAHGPIQLTVLFVQQSTAL